MRRIFMFLVFFLMLQFLAAIELSGSADMTYGDDVTILQAKNKCKVEAVRLTLENFIMSIESETIVRDGEIEKDVIYAKTKGLVRKVVPTFEMDRGKSWVKCYVTFEINEKEVEDALKKSSGRGSIEDIQSSGEYYYGLGENKREIKADRSALENLIENITIDKKDSYADLVGKDEDLYEFTLSVIGTFRTSFNHCKKKIDGNKVLRYIKRSELDNIFANRIKKIHDFIDSGSKAEKEARIGVAIKYYYWAFSLLRSHPDHNKLIYANFSTKFLSHALYEKIELLFEELDFNVSKNEYKNNVRDISIVVLYKGAEVQNLELKYHLGDDWSMTYPVLNGFLQCELIGSYAEKAKKLRLRIEYRYEQKVFDKELLNTLQNVSPVYFSTSERWINLNREYPEPEKQPVAEVVEKVVKKEKKKAISLNDFISENKEFKDCAEVNLDNKQKRKCLDTVEKIVDVINTKEYDKIDSLFNENGKESFEKLLKYGNAKLLTEKIELKVGQVYDEIVVRSIPMQFKFPNNNRVTTENVNFTFDKDMMIDHISFSLSNIAIKDIMSKGDGFATIQEKLILLQFMENYKTAYCLKELDYVKKVFADNALIIVGKVLKKSDKQIGEMYDKLPQEKIKYVTYSKKEYMDQLEIVFRSNEFINLEFENNEILKVGGKERIYGIQIKQNYYSSNYADEGYLFLMMDLNNPKEPTIYVRSWQPEKSMDGSIIGLSDFSY